jgi:hypothetical protein
MTHPDDQGINLDIFAIACYCLGSGKDTSGIVEFLEVTSI